MTMTQTTEVAHLRSLAARCRELAQGAGGSRPTQYLTNLAEGYEARAAAIERPKAPAHA